MLTDPFLLQIHSVVEGLKEKVISSASSYLKNKDEMVRKPIEMWTHMALAVTGTLSKPICKAFSQVWQDILTTHFLP